MVRTFVYRTFEAHSSVLMIAQNIDGARQRHSLKIFSKPIPLNCDSSTPSDEQKRWKMCTIGIPYELGAASTSTGNSAAKDLVEVARSIRPSSFNKLLGLFSPSCHALTWCFLHSCSYSEMFATILLFNEPYLSLLGGSLQVLRYCGNQSQLSAATMLFY